MKPRRAILCGWAAALLLGAGARASAPPRDLGQGLTYYRLHELPQDLPSGRPGACVLDLRFTRSDRESAGALKAWVRFNLSARTPVFVLENSQTDLALLAILHAGGPAGQIVLAPAAEPVTADVRVDVSPASDRRAYEALETGAALASLVTDYPDKPRVDEAYLEKEHISDSEAPDPAADKSPPPKSLTDPVLQRAVQLYRGLKALRRL